MAIGDAYATAAEYRAVKDKDSNADDAEIERELKAISRYIDKITGRAAGFNKDAANVARIFVARTGRAPLPGWAESENPWLYGGMSRVLDIDDLVSVASVKLDENLTGSFTKTLAAADYELLPRNADVGPETAPYRQIELTSWGSQVAWPSGARVEVTGIWGWPAVPDGIKEACIELTAILRMESPRATSRVNEAQQVISTSRVGQSIVAELTHEYLNPAVLI